MPDFDALVIGVSFGGLSALTTLCVAFSKNFSIPVFIVQHQLQTEGRFLAEHLYDKCKLEVTVAKSTEKVKPRRVYLSASGYHLLIEHDLRLSLSVDEPINCSIPSIDVLFDSASDVYGKRLLGIILTGSSNDGSAGLARLVSRGGAIVQSPEDAAFEYMPKSAIQTVRATNIDRLKILKLKDIALFIQGLNVDD